MKLPFHIALRYLFAKKSQQVIHLISAISATGMAVGTAALIIILSVFNGFESMVRASMSTVEPDFLITPASGKAFVPDMEGLAWAYGNDRIASISNVIQENVYLSYDGNSGLAKAKGVDEAYMEASPLREHLVQGEYRLHQGDLPMALVGAGLAASMRINPHFNFPIALYFPSRTEKISLARPAAAIERTTVFPSGLFSINSLPDNELLLLPIENMRRLLGYDREVSAVEIRLAADCTEKEARSLLRELSARLGAEFQVLDRFRQNPSLYKMMNYEKAAVYMILLFIILIVGFNIFGSLSMLIAEKGRDIATLRCLGAEEKEIKRIFVLEGWMIALAGMTAGLIAGLGLCRLQTAFGFIKMPAGFLFQPYPVIVTWPDVLLCALSITAVGYLIALLPVRSCLKDSLSTLVPGT